MLSTSPQGLRGSPYRPRPSCSKLENEKRKSGCGKVRLSHPAAYSLGVMVSRFLTCDSILAYSIVVSWAAPAVIKTEPSALHAWLSRHTGAKLWEEMPGPSLHKQNDHATLEAQDICHLLNTICRVLSDLRHNQVEKSSKSYIKLQEQTACVWVT